jgi:hypothetical protein
VACRRGFMLSTRLAEEKNETWLIIWPNTRRITATNAIFSLYRYSTDRSGSRGFTSSRPGVEVVGLYCAQRRWCTGGGRPTCA